MTDSCLCITLVGMISNHCPKWIRYNLLVLLFLLSSCGADFKVLDSTDDPDFWGATQSKIWIEGSRQNIFALVVQDDSLMGKVTGTNGGIQVYYVLEPPPWSNSRANHLIRTAQAWQNSFWWSSAGHGLESIAITMGATLRQRRYLISINPLVIATSNETVSSLQDDHRVNLVDLSKNIITENIKVFEGEYPAHAYLMGGQKDEGDQIRAHTRVIATRGMTLTKILNSPSLWQEQKPPG